MKSESDRDVLPRNGPISVSPNALRGQRVCFYVGKQEAHGLLAVAGQNADTIIGT
jgi:hypothetical protein